MGFNYLVHISDTPPTPFPNLSAQCVMRQSRLHLFFKYTYAFSTTRDYLAN